MGLSHAQLLSVSSTGEMAVLLDSHPLGTWVISGTLARAPLSGGAPRPVVEEVQWADWSPDGVNLAIGGGEPQTIRELQPGEQPITWSGDGRFLYIYRPGELPTEVVKVDLNSGQRTPFKQLMPSDLAAVETIGPILLTPDGKTCVYGYHRMLSDLYLVEGQK
jgi:hypothetical protein